MRTLTRQCTVEDYSLTLNRRPLSCPLNTDVLSNIIVKDDQGTVLNLVGAIAGGNRNLLVATIPSQVAVSSVTYIPNALSGGTANNNLQNIAVTNIPGVNVFTITATATDICDSAVYTVDVLRQPNMCPDEADVLDGITVKDNTNTDVTLDAAVDNSRRVFEATVASKVDSMYYIKQFEYC